MKQYDFLQGRLGRSDYALRLLLALVPLLPASFLPAPQVWYEVLLAGLVLAVSTALAALLSVRRLHDVYLSGWYALVLLVPLVNLLAYMLLAVRPGTPGLNPWGPAPGTQLIPIPVATPAGNEPPVRRWLSSGAD
ncbi:DUF805 domain-containing protein [Hymenobacter sp. APR13]|uniref:DUF805 domain-containing protein n=1 Tax=Hymenobacter sp. APR13 TaxID=1356852 RepID=UPI0004E09C6B|nr:DUF805 domain-containing protein [Hymenobacter sp. APR13]AII50992.1 hypothetical protein N008_03215 [Hymenobacter sp. APR13]